MRNLLRWLLVKLYGFQAWNEEVLRTPGPVLLLPNHVSWWDWLLIGVCLEDDWRFVTSSTSAEASWVHKRLMVNRRTFPVDIHSPFAVKRMAEYLRDGGRLVLFPEGRLSRTGSLMKLFDGTGFLIYKTRAKVITAYVRNAQRLPWSPNPSVKQWFPRLSVHFGRALTTPVQEHVRPLLARAQILKELRDQMTNQQFETEMTLSPATLPAAIVEASRHRPDQAILQDVTMKELSYDRLLLGADVLSRQWPVILGRDQARVGVLLPNVNAMPVTLLSLWAADRIPAVLNFSTGTANLLVCAKLAGLKFIITSRIFLERSKLELGPLKAGGITLLFLEDIRASVSFVAKLAAWFRSWIGSPLPQSATTPDDVAVILFTSGSEGTPKGVELTHRNLLSNIRQMVSVIDLMESDRFFNALPLFHSFGLTVGLLLPLVRGVFVFLYVSPLHYRVVPSAFYGLDCTVFFATNTFLAGYARKAHPYDFRSLRYVFAAGEKLQEATANVWMRRLGVRVLEGYGATECSPCLTVNVPMVPCEGSVGQFLPGVEYKLEPVEGVTTDAGNVGRLFVRGPNIMRGYLNPEANAHFQELDGWYDTGDIVKVADDGFVFIQGRLKRFAKISGEMVSLTAVEDALAGAFPQYGLRFAVAVIARPDEAKGEKLVAVTNEPKLTLEQVRDVMRAKGLSNLAVPREIKAVREIPKLGTGKIAHRELEKVMQDSEAKPA